MIVGYVEYVNGLCFGGGGGSIFFFFLFIFFFKQKTAYEI